MKIKDKKEKFMIIMIKIMAKIVKGIDILKL
jgi:hypothetical protein